MMIVIALLILVLVAVGGYFLLIHPLLKSRPKLAEFREIDGSLSSAIALKVDTIKTKLLASAILIASILVETHDLLQPMMGQFDWTPITSRLPPWAWPIINMAMAAAFYWLRKLTEKSELQKLSAVQAGMVTTNELVQPTAETIVTVKSLPVPTPEKPPE